MNHRVAIIGIIVEKKESIEKMNRVLHTYGSYIIGRMGIPYKERDINVISVVVDASEDIISALSGKLGAIQGISAKAVYSKQAYPPIE